MILLPRSFYDCFQSLPIVFGQILRVFIKQCRDCLGDRASEECVQQVTQSRPARAFFLQFWDIDVPCPVLFMTNDLFSFQNSQKGPDC